MTATSSQGLALMAEVVYIAAAMRAPIVMAVGNRALSGPINIHCDHCDTMVSRDTGSVQLYAENPQEAYDLTVLEPRMAEHPDVRLPVLVCLDGFTITHSAEPVELLADADVTRFVGAYEIPNPLLDTAQPDDARAVRDAGLLLRASAPADRRAGGRARRSCRGARAGTSSSSRDGRYGTGREATGSTARSACSSRSARQQGRSRTLSTSCARRATRVGLREDRARSGLSHRLSSRELLHDVESVIVLDRAASPGGAAPLRAEVAATLDTRKSVDGHVYGLGGRDLHPEDVRDIFDGRAGAYVGLRGEPCLA